MVSKEDLESAMLKLSESSGLNYDKVRLLVRAMIEHSKNNPINGQIWKCAKEMFNNIKDHCKNNNGQIVQDDDILLYQIGYKCTKTNRQWRICSKNIRISDYKEILTSEEYKITLLNNLNSI